MHGTARTGMMTDLDEASASPGFVLDSHEACMATSSPKELIAKQTLSIRHRHAMHDAAAVELQEMMCWSIKLTELDMG